MEKSSIDAVQAASTIHSTLVTVNQAWESEDLPASPGFIVLAMRNNGELNAWLDIEPELPEKMQHNAIHADPAKSGAAFYARNTCFYIAYTYQ